ncbi:MAG: hypothetical protein HY863_10395 [Chloroflexi bacterium]|nr:hypothetical protein [Chloroflexota bacterium]
MEDLNSTLVILIGLALRVLVPVALTALIVYLLRKLDARWQEEARTEEKVLAIDEMSCLETQGLSDEQLNSRLSLNAQPCWQIHRLPNGYLKEACLDCEIFLKASAASPRSRAHI